MMIGASVLLMLVAADPAPSSVLIDEMEACRQTADDRARLACFDRTTAAIAAARARREILVMDRTQVRKARRSLFGFVIPSFKLFGGTAADDEAEGDINQIDAKVAAVADLGYNRLTLTLDDGTVWQTSEFAQAFRPRKGDSILIKRTPFGFRAKSGYGQVPVQRVR